METVDPRLIPRELHVMSRRRGWGVRWSDGKRALRVLNGQGQAISYAKKAAAGKHSVIVHTPEGFADVKRSILVPSKNRSLAVW